jgi:two-component system chemotaxis sensor kinase CheA
MDDPMEFRDAFFEEAAEHVASIESRLLRIEQGVAEADDLHAIFRAAHSIKGLAATLDLGEVAAFTHDMESLLDALRSGAMSVTPALVHVLLRSKDSLQGLLDASRRDRAADVDTSASVAELRAALGVPTPTPSQPAVAAAVIPQLPAGTGPARLYSIRFLPKPGFLGDGRDALLVVRDLQGLGDEATVVCDTTRLAPLETLDPTQCQLIWVVKVLTRADRDTIAQVFRFVEDECEYSIRDVTADPSRAGVAENAPPLKGAAIEAKAPSDASIRVPVEKVDTIVDLVGELVISQSMVNEIVGTFELSRLAELQDALGTLGRATRELQERVMSIRMMPVGTVFNRFPRLVRDVSAKLGKRVKLELVGAETELDKGMIERIGDPLTHLVRNAIDHGLETPDVRLESGKSDTGTLYLRASHESGNVMIEVRDDGKGLDVARIRQKAITNGLIRADDVLSEDELHALIFAPGFSTATQVSDLSGRGVGMDVVKRIVESLSGSVSISSTAGLGTRVRIRLPLTLAILDGLVIAVGGESYVLPLLSVVESLRPQPRDVRALVGGGELLIVRGEMLPFVRLHDLLGHDDGITEPSLGIVVILESDERRFGVLADDVLGRQQVVIKNLEANYRKIDAVMGATILGDGRISLILDVPELLRPSATWQPESTLPGTLAVAAPSHPESLA